MYIQALARKHNYVIKLIRQLAVYTVLHTPKKGWGIQRFGLKAMVYTYNEEAGRLR